MKMLKSIEMKNFDLKVTQDEKYFYVYIEDHKAMTSKNLKNVLDYFDMVYEQFLTRNN